MALHKHWRIHFSYVGRSYATVREIWMRDSGGVDLNVTIGGVVSASSEYSGSYLATNAFDRNTSSPWCNIGNAFPSWIQFSFFTPVDLETVDILQGPATSELTSAPQSSYSDNGFQWSGTAEMPLLLGTISESTTASWGIGSGWVAPIDVQGRNLGMQRHFTGILVPNVNVKKLGFSKPPQNFFYSGNGRVYGYVGKDAAPAPNVPLRRKVVLCRGQDNLPVAVTWSRASDGFYEFLHVNTNDKFYALAFDYEHDNRMVGADNLTPELMP